ncbi:MAG: acetolactate synthase small subunit [Dehalococcoidia bacterium]|jgi:acetolactate synthase-1/3 small subunit|nr:acetolactate synthase small subunit [Chloroflexota bacterium]MBP05933.1 acetolactate synthase small subunit [Chloroflexota bacterium]OUW95518.1 MAG: acetolactate synthase small subunit [Chloroflexi bacterium TMED230]RZP13574.1 MAG: acetolactate synthase small subunit [Chloroflexota bacterium]|tara:strand:+ start:7333 stop:7911 length:579 start_codon:yes stop_codon:yes gene_type:complete
MAEGIHRRTIIALVHDKPGVLARISGLFRRRGVNIESLAVGHSEQVGFSRMTFVVGGAENSVKNISSQLNKLIDVVDASDISEKNIVWRELALIKVKCNQSQRVEILELSKVFRVNVVDVGINNISFELAGGKSKIDSFIELLDQFGVLEVMRTGRIATLRGATKIGINDGEFSALDNSDIYIADKDASGSV